mmetsp:Transcript_8833/g.12155  ORF Transcript_8833/g.12155 Transcript_8833/m.12155 type:complete len:223 (+) Transcript_8833:419-1087(+)
MLLTRHFVVVTNACSRVWASHSTRARTWVPVDSRSLLFEHVDRADTVLIFLLDETSVEVLSFLARCDIKLGRLDGNNDIGVSLLRLNELLKVRLAGFNGSNDVLLLVSALNHITFDLPSLLDRIGDINVEGEVKGFNHILVQHRVETLYNDDVVRVNGFNRVDSSSVMVVDWLLDSTSLLQSLQLVGHKSEVVSANIESGDTSLSPSGTVKSVEVVEADGSD